MRSSTRRLFYGVRNFGLEASASRQALFDTDLGVAYGSGDDDLATAPTATSARPAWTVE